MQVAKYANRVMYPNFEIQDKRHQKSKRGILVDFLKDLWRLKITYFYLKYLYSSTLKPTVSFVLFSRG